MFTIQRVRVRWTAAERAAPHADAVVAWIARLRYRLRLPTSDVVVHGVLADVAVGYVRREQVLAGGLEQARAVGLWLSWDGLALTAERPPGWAAYPRSRRPARLLITTPCRSLMVSSRGLKQERVEPFAYAGALSAGFLVGGRA